MPSTYTKVEEFIFYETLTGMWKVFYEIELQKF